MKFAFALGLLGLTIQPQGTPRVVTSAEIVCQPADAGSEVLRCIDERDAIEFDVHQADTSWLEVWPID